MPTRANDQISLHTLGADRHSHGLHHRVHLVLLSVQLRVMDGAHHAWLTRESGARVQSGGVCEGQRADRR